MQGLILNFFLFWVPILDFYPCIWLPPQLLLLIKLPYIVVAKKSEVSCLFPHHLSLSSVALSCDVGIRRRERVRDGLPWNIVTENMGDGSWVTYVDHEGPSHLTLLASHKYLSYESLLNEKGTHHFYSSITTPLTHFNYLYYHYLEIIRVILNIDTWHFLLLI